ncbi:MAG: response regulator [Methylococcales bacterium]|nr:response regulator [Methylococcales bacterium]
MNNNEHDVVVYLVDDEFAVRDSLSLLIESAWFPVKSFESAESFLDHYDPAQAGCLLLDVRMPSMSGLELQDELLRRNISIPIIFISGHAGIPDSAKAFRTGAVDFLEKPFDNKILMERIKEAIKKDVDIRKELTQQREIVTRLDNLTTREQEVMSLIVRGLSNKDAARKMDISPRTVEVHRARIMEKMQAASLADLMIMAKHCKNIL